jgi:hypothetical protein
VPVVHPHHASVIERVDLYPSSKVWNRMRLYIYNSSRRLRSIWYYRFGPSVVGNTSLVCPLFVHSTHHWLNASSWACLRRGRHLPPPPPPSSGNGAQEWAFHAGCSARHMWLFAASASVGRGGDLDVYTPWIPMARERHKTGNVSSADD